MRYYPAPDDAELLQLNAQSWQLDILKRNPDYCNWGNFEDYMSKEGAGWDARLSFENWSSFGPWRLDTYNEIANFYFETFRSSHECEVCDGTALNQATKQLYDSFDRSRHQLTTIESQALAANNRPLTDLPIDSVQKWICIKATATAADFFGSCPHCDDGRQYDKEQAQTALQLWFLHPRKGCSRGVHIEEINVGELPEILEYLQAAARSNASRFAGILEISNEA